MIFAVRVAGAGDPLGENIALQVAAEFTLHIGREAVPCPAVFACAREIGLQLLLYDLVEGGLLKMAPAVPDRTERL